MIIFTFLQRSGKIYGSESLHLIKYVGGGKGGGGEEAAG